MFNKIKNFKIKKKIEIHRESDYKNNNPSSKLTKLHFYAFGGIKKTSEWLKKFNTTLEKSLEGSLELNKLALENHASILRVHDVKETKSLIDKFIL